MTFEQIQDRCRNVQARLSKMADNFQWENQDVYVSWLAQTYEYANFTTRILALTAGHFPVEKTQFSNRFIQHAAEEKGHERLLINDAKALGYDLLKQPVLAEAEAFHKSLYFWIYQGKPVVIFGWVLSLECFAVDNGPKVFARVEKKFGKKAASFLYVHGHEDPDHVAKAFETIKNLPESDLDQIAHGLDLYASLYESIYRAIERDVAAQGKLNAA